MAWVQFASGRQSNEERKDEFSVFHSPFKSFRVESLFLF